MQPLKFGKWCVISFYVNGHVTTYPCWDQIQAMLVNEAPSAWSGWLMPNEWRGCGLLFCSSCPWLYASMRWRMGRVTLVVIVGTAILVPYYVIRYLQLKWRSGTVDEIGWCPTFKWITIIWFEIWHYFKDVRLCAIMAYSLRIRFSTKALWHVYKYVCFGNNTLRHVCYYQHIFVVCLLRR